MTLVRVCGSSASSLCVEVSGQMLRESGDLGTPTMRVWGREAETYTALPLAWHCFLRMLLGIFEATNLDWIGCASLECPSIKINKLVKITH